MGSKVGSLTDTAGVHSQAPQPELRPFGQKKQDVPGSWFVEGVEAPGSGMYVPGMHATHSLGFPTAGYDPH